MAARKRRNLTKKEKKRLEKLEGMLQQLKRKHGKNVQNRQLHTWLSEDETISLSDYYDRNKEIYEIFSLLDDKQIKFIDVQDNFCSERYCSILNNSGLPLFSDNNHVNEIGANIIVNQLIRSGL